MKTRALLATAIDRIELADAEIPEPGAGEVLIEAWYTAISPGTEMRCLAGRQPNLGFPFVPGYSMVGRVLARGEGTRVSEGALVFCQGTTKANRPLAWGGHVGHAIQPESGVFSVPDGVDPIEAALTKLGAIAYRGVRVAQTKPHDEVAVVGLGIIGQLAARLHQVAGGRVVAADVSAERVALAQAAGIEAIQPTDGLVAAFLDRQPRGADVIVDSTGAPAVLQQSIQLGKMKPWDDALHEPSRLVIQGSYAENVIFDYHQAFFRELAVHFPRDCQPRDLQLVLRLLAQRQLRVRDLVTEISPPAEAQRVYSALRAATPGLVTAVFQWR